MDEDFRTEPPANLSSFLGKLQEVLDVCDDASDGLIGFDDLLKLGSQFGQVEQVRTTWLLGKTTMMQKKKKVYLCMKYRYYHGVTF